MGFFDSIQKPGFKAAKGKNSHIEQQVTKAAAPVRLPIPLNQRLNNRQLPKKPAFTQKSGSANSSPRSQGSSRRKRPAILTPQVLESDSDDGISDQCLETAKKRTRRASDVAYESKRRIRSEKAFSEEQSGEFPMVHGADVASLSKPTKFSAAFPNDPQALEIHLQYPSSSQREK